MTTGASGNGSTQDHTFWPLPKFQFSFSMGGMLGASFQEVTGLDAEAQIIEYRAGDSAQFSTAQMPGLKKYDNVTMKKGIFVNDNKFWTWFSAIQMNTIQRQTGTISCSIKLARQRWSGLSIMPGLPKSQVPISRRMVMKLPWNR